MIRRWTLAASLALAACCAVGELRITGLAVRDMDPVPPVQDGTYSVTNSSTADLTETRLYSGTHHFGSLLTTDGIFAIRPHPGVDPNGWGSTLYLQPFIAGARLRHSDLNSVTVTSTGIVVSVSGNVSRGTKSKFGTWSVPDLVITYDGAGKRLQATGHYAISLSGEISSAGGDLNIYKLASNYLDDVPLLDGSTGDTGDMRHAIYSASGVTNIWIPPLQPGHFPGPSVNDLSISAVGDFYDVDTLAQTWTNFRAIQAAWKPTLRVELVADQPGYGMIPGFVYDTGKAKLFYEDNVGITPVIPASSAETDFGFAVTIESTALPADGIGIIADITAKTTPPTDITECEVYFSPALPFVRTNRFVGTLRDVSSAAYEGTMEIPDYGSSTERGVFLIKGP